MKFKLFYLILCIFFVIIIIFFGIKKEENMFMGLTKITDYEMDSLIDGKNKSNIEIELLYNNSLVSKMDNDYLISVNNKHKKVKGKISAKKGLDIYIIDNESKLDNIIENNEFAEILIVSNNKYDIKKIYFTNLSVMSIDRKSTNTLNDIILYDVLKFSDSGLTDINTFTGEIKQRGGMSTAFPKKSYRLEIDENRSLLKMRKDDDWILNPIYSDATFLREKIAYEIWNGISNINNHDLEYIELIIDGEYQGIYYLQEPVDHKTFNVDKKNNYLYSIKDLKKGRQVNKNSEIIYSNDVIINEFSLEKVNNDNLNIMIDNLIMLDEFNLKGINNDIFNYNIDNFLKYNIFINLISAPDNCYKNQKIMLKSVDNKYELSKSPWDLDVSMRNPSISVEWFGPEDKIYYDEARYQEDFNSDEMKNFESTIYFDFRNQIYNEKYINYLITKYSDMILKSGALIRDNIKWGRDNLNVNSGTVNKEFSKFDISAYEEDLKYIKNNLLDRIKLLDKFYSL